MNFNVTLKEVLSKLDTFMVIKNGCPFCIRAADLLRSHEIPFEEFDHTKFSQLDQDIKEATGHTTYPKIYLNKEWVGGCSDLYAQFKDKDIMKSKKTDL